MNLRFVFIVGIFTGVVLLTYREEVLGSLLGPLTALTASTTFVLLDLIGVDVLREASVIYQPGGFAYEIYYRCTGFLPVACLTVSILAHSGCLRHKLAGLAVGIPFLIILNLVRLVHLFLIGVTRPDLLDLAHSVLWEGGIILAVLGFWLIWKKWAYTQSLHSRRSSQTNPERVRAIHSVAGRSSAMTGDFRLQED